MWLIVGLGNPGAQYELTRHNLGFLAVDSLLDRARAGSMTSKFNSLYARIELNGQPCAVIKPQTFMNRSGQAVQAAMSFHKVELKKIIVIHDEIDLPLGEIRIKLGGSNGGHNGLKDITRLIGGDFLRVRLGVGRPAFKGNEADYVLSPFHKSEMVLVEETLVNALAAVDGLVEHGLEFAQQKCQTRPKKN